jgi:hypothetical protein
MLCLLLIGYGPFNQCDIQLGIIIITLGKGKSFDIGRFKEFQEPVLAVDNDQLITIAAGKPV